MDDISSKQYQNLRTCFNKNLVSPILGDDYYNMGQDVYSADLFTTDDLKSKFDGMKERIKIFKLLLYILAVINVLLLFKILF